MTELKNAIIKSVKFDTERGLSMWIFLEYGGSSQGFGGYLLYAPKGWEAHNQPGNHCGHFIYRVLEIAGVDDIAKLPGKAIRVKADHCGVSAIGHIINDDWFDPKQEFAELNKEQSK